MDFHSITDPYIPSWVKAEVQGTANLFDCNDGCSLPMADEQNEQQLVENNCSNDNNQNMQEIPDPNTGGAPAPEPNNFVDDNMPVIEESNLLWPVSPFEAGEGLPYAPIDWPNPGDTWTWRVGRRVNIAGYFQDRFLYPPKHIVPAGAQKFFASKAACETFIRSNFPGVDVGSFFASFSWKIPAKVQPPPKDEPAPAPAPVPMAENTPQDNVETVEEKKNKPAPRYSKRERKQRIEKVEAVEEEETKGRKAKVPRSTPRKRKQNADPSSTASPVTTGQRKSKGSSRRSSRSAAVHGEDQQEAMADLIPEDFDNYLNSLEDMLGQPLQEHTIPTFLMEDSSIPEDEMVKARNKLSSLLLRDFPLLISSKNFSQLTTLASKVRKDPMLTADQLVKLKLIDELPLFSEVYSESRQAIHQVEKFFGTLEGNKAKVATMKNEYSELKEKADQLQSLVDSSVMAVQDIDDQIAQLKARRAELTKTIETNRAAKVEVSFIQKMVASQIPNVVHEIQVANTRIPEMELKKINAQKREVEILEKFAPLKGFTL